MREQQAHYHKTLDGMLADMQQGGVWSDEDAGRFFQTVWTDAEGKAVDTQRQKAGERYKVQAMAAQAWNGQRGQSPEMLRGMCLLGPRLLEEVRRCMRRLSAPGPTCRRNWNALPKQAR